MSIQLGFKAVSEATYRKLVLQDVPLTVIKEDISVYLRDSFSQIRNDFNTLSYENSRLADDWPGDVVVENLVDRAVPLFIVAATVQRFVGEPGWNPQKRLDEIVGKPGTESMSQMEFTYLPVVQQLTPGTTNRSDRELFYQEVRAILGSIITLGEALSINSLASLLDIPPSTVEMRLRRLSSVLELPKDPDTPFRTLHLSFDEFLMSDEVCGQPYGIEKAEAHKLLMDRCLYLLSSAKGLRENICDLEHPGYLRKDISISLIETKLPPDLKYACRYWVHHVVCSTTQLHDNGSVFEFLKTHFLHWFEALSLMKRSAELVGFIGLLQSAIGTSQPGNVVQLEAFLKDAKKFVLANQHVTDLAPLQLYSSAIIFTPSLSLTRNWFGSKPDWIEGGPAVPETWSSELVRLRGHSSGVTTVAFSPDGDLLASGSRDKSIRLWNVSTGVEVKTLRSHDDTVTAVTFSPDGNSLASSSEDKTPRIWDVRSGQLIRALYGACGFRNVSFSPDGTRIVGLQDKTLQIWHISTWRRIDNLKQDTGFARNMDFSFNYGFVASVLNKKTMKVWDMTTEQDVFQWRGESSFVHDVCFSFDGKLLAWASEASVFVWSVVNKKMTHELDQEGAKIAFSRDSSMLALAGSDGVLRIWDLIAGREVQRFEGCFFSIHEIAFSNNDRLLASACEDYTAIIWEVGTGKVIQQFSNNVIWVTKLSFSPNGKMLAAISIDGTTRLWDVVTGKQLHNLKDNNENVTKATFSHDSQLIALSSEGTVYVWNTFTGKMRQRLKGHSESATAMVFSPARKWILASSSDDTTVRLWNISTGQELRRLAHSVRVKCIAFAPKNTELLASGSVDGTVRIWNTNNGQQVRSLVGHLQGVISVAYKPDGKMIASSTQHDVRIWDANAGQELQSIRSRIKHFRAAQQVLLQSYQWCLQLDDELVLHCLEMGHEFSGRPRTRSAITTTSNHEWIQRDGRNLLWLPHEYRGDKIALYQNTIAISYNRGQVIFIRLDYSKTDDEEL